MTAIHRANFFLKIGVGLVLSTLAWLIPEWWAGAALSALVLITLWLVGTPGLRGYLRGAALLVLLVMASWLVNLSIQGVPVSEALTTGIKLASRLVTTTAAFFFIMATTSPGAILAACSAARLPPIATLTLSLLFGVIPMLQEDFARIADAQRARGMEIDEVGFLQRLRFALARGVPLLVQAIRMAHAISLTLELGGFDLGRKRTTWREVGLLVDSPSPRHVQENDP
ncbi:energy-coupling factor transporter transmembrane component T family protein [Salipiger mucosus]|uniref:Transmembrane component of general energizing module of ECF transporter n=1 Tax=Salipiger mucosus DSM 16094 TaxID=1123237 RepID=S9Q530_9RHOB|nr:energy-coupling factor transporter transmembrane component T [Salipiger mucosus]EPX76461.1 Transmembrane component of general energizing module of ECF transporter [Salipiger mucosus DSM 16094]